MQNAVEIIHNVQHLHHNSDDDDNDDDDNNSSHSESFTGPTAKQPKLK